MLSRSPREIAVRALKRVGSYTQFDNGPDGEELDEALHWLDMVVGHYMGARQYPFMVAETLTVSITEGVQDYDLQTAVGDDWPAEGFQFPISATYQAANSDPDPLAIWRRVEWEERTSATSEDRPRAIYIDRRAVEPRLKVHPIPADDYTINLVVQKYTPDYTKLTGNQGTELHNSWQLWMVQALVAELMDGVIYRGSDGEVTRARNRANELLMDLQAFNDKEHNSQPEIVPYTDQW